MIELKIRKLRNDVPTPEYKTKGAAAFDLHAMIDEPLAVEPHQQVLIPTGLSMAIPEGYEGQVRPRSGRALNGIGIANSPGTIDSDYRGEVKLIAYNYTQTTKVIEVKERVAQMAICPVMQASFLCVEELDDTARGEGGFGHSGKV